MGAFTVGLALVLAAGACAADPAESMRDEGQLCTAAMPCAPYLLCLGGRCVARPTPPSPAPRPLPDAVHPDTSFEDAVAPEVIDMAEPEHDGVEATDATFDSVGETRTLLGPHDALVEPSDTRLGLVLGQAAVREVIVPEAAEVLGVEVVLAAPEGTPSACAKYEVAIWESDGAGAFTVPPTFRSAALFAVARASPTEPVWLALPERVPVRAGALRFGLVYGGPCELSVPPFIALDRSGLSADTFIWANVWIPAVALELEGRWGLSLAIAAPTP